MTDHYEVMLALCLNSRQDNDVDIAISALCSNSRHKSQACEVEVFTQQ